MQLSTARRTDAPASHAPGPIGPREFAALLDPLGPFEPAPHLAVAVSGGRDSMALALFGAEWTRARGGRLSALTVDHALRPGSAGEAATVAGWLRAQGIAHETLRLTDRPPAHGVEEWARSARYAALERWCRAHGVLHLLLAHHREDQGETWLMRTARGTGSAGAAAMAAVRELSHVRLLRPLLGVPRARLTETLQSRGVAWLEDPMNRDPRFDRAALRRDAADAQGRYEFAAAAASAAASGDRRRADERALAGLAAHCVGVHPAGFVTIARAPFMTADPSLAASLLGRCLAAVGGRAYAPRRERLARLAGHLREGPAFAGRTLAGCRILPHRGGAAMLIFREPAAIADRMAMVAPEMRWDGRFVVRMEPPGASGFAVGALGSEGWRAVAGSVADSLKAAVPGPVRPVLPALFRSGQPVSVPALGLQEAGAPLMRARFAPPQPVAGAAFGKIRLSSMPRIACRNALPRGDREPI